MAALPVIGFANNICPKCGNKLALGSSTMPYYVEYMVDKNMVKIRCGVCQYFVVVPPAS